MHSATHGVARLLLALFARRGSGLHFDVLGTFFVREDVMYAPLEDLHQEPMDDHKIDP